MIYVDFWFLAEFPGFIGQTALEGINASTGLLYVLLFSGTELQVMMTLERVLMKNFLFASCQANIHAISLAP